MPAKDTSDAMKGTHGGVIVVGGAGDIGSTLVRHYRSMGVPVAIVDKKKPYQGSETNQGAPLHSVIADVTRLEDLTSAQSELHDLDWSVEHLVSLAGGALDDEFEPFANTRVATFEDSIALNLTSHLKILHSFLPILGSHNTPSEVGKDASITLVSSINALQDYGLPAYSAAKAGLLGLVRSLTTELGAQGIRINAVLPGTVPTTASAAQPKDYEALRRGTALGRLTQPDDVADAIISVTHSMTAVTGQYLVVDCGQTVTSVQWRHAEGQSDESWAP